MPGSWRYYADKGWPLFPAVPRKRGAFIEGYKEAATSDWQTIEAWLRRWPNAEPGLVTGKGIIVLDIDQPSEDKPDRPDGYTALVEREKMFTPLPRTPLARTPNNGLHFYFAGENLRAVTLWPGADTVSNGKSIRLPPGTHPSGVRYEWAVDPSVPLAPIPAWIVNIIRLKSSPERKRKPYAPAKDGAVRYAASRIQSAAVGERNNTLHRQAVFLRHIVDRGEIDEAEARAALRSAAGAAGLGRDEIKTTIDSAFRKDAG